MVSDYLITLSGVDGDDMSVRSEAVVEVLTEVLSAMRFSGRQDLALLGSMLLPKLPVCSIAGLEREYRALLLLLDKEAPVGVLFWIIILMLTQ